jgi:hypothetical protein
MPWSLGEGIQALRLQGNRWGRRFARLGNVQILGELPDKFERLLADWDSLGVLMGTGFAPPPLG